MKTHFPSAWLALWIGLANPAAAQTVLQWGFDSTTGAVEVPVIDDSGAVVHDGTNLIDGGAAPVYSADIPTVGPAVGQAQNVTGIGAVDFTGTSAGISTAASNGVGSGQGIMTAADVFNAGGFTMEVWVKNPSHTTPVPPQGIALTLGGMHFLGELDGRIGWVNDNGSTAWATDQFVAGEWNHLAVVMKTDDPTAKAYTDISAYLNGTLIHSAPYTFPWFLDRAVAVGNHQYNNWADYDGLVYEPRVSLGAMAPSQFTVVPPAGSLTAPKTLSDSTNGADLPLTVTISNSAATVYQVTGISFTGTAAADFRDDFNDFPLEIPAGGSADVYVLFTPATGGLAEATLTLATDDPNAPALTVLLSAEVHDPEILIASNYHFGSFMFLPGPTVGQLPVDNFGWNEDLTLSNPQITGAGAAAYSVTSLPGSITESDVIEITFNPTAAGQYPAQLALDTNDPFKPTVTVTLGGTVAGGGTPVLQWGFDAATGPVEVPVIDDSGAVVHDGTDLLFGAAPVYSADIPAASMTQNVTGVGSLDFSATHAAISTAASAGVGSGQGIITATDVFNAGGLTMEVWVKNPAVGTVGEPGAVLNMGGMYVLGMHKDGRLGFIHGDNSNDISWTTDQFVASEWNHLAVLMMTNDPAAMTYTDIRFYLNGVLIHSAPHTFPWFLDRAVTVGNHQYGDWNPYDGLVYEPRVSLGTMGINELTVVPGLKTMASVTGQSDGEATSLPVTIANSAGVVYQVTGVAYSGADAADFSGIPTLPLVIPTGGSDGIMVDFVPSHGSGTYTATLTLTTDDPNRPTIEVTLAVVVAGADTNRIRVTGTSLVSPTRMRIDFEAAANTACQVKSSADLQEAIFTGEVTVAVDGLTTDDIGGGRGVGFVEFDITVPGRMFYQIQTP